MNMLAKTAVAISCAMMFLAGCGTSNAASAEPNTSNIVFREPFTHKLRTGKDQIYEEHITEKIPYVADNNVYLFYGESFGLKLTVADGEISNVAYQKDKTGADVEVEFKQEDGKDGKPMTLLILKSNIKQVLHIDALMLLPDDKNIHRTSIMPLQPGLEGFEYWPHPIVQLALTNLRFKETVPNNAPAKN